MFVNINSVYQKNQVKYVIEFHIKENFMTAADKLVYLIANSNLNTTTKSFIGGVLKDLGESFNEETYEEEAEEHNESEMELISQLQDLLEKLMDMEGEEMEGEEMEAEAEEMEDEEEDEDEDDFNFGEEEDNEEDDTNGGSVKIMRGMF